MEELTSLGTVVDWTGPKGKIELNDRNLAGTKRIIATLINAKKERLKVVMSENVTNDLRSKKITLGQVAQLEMFENEEGVVYVAQPAGNVVSVNINDLTIEAIEREPVDVEDLITL